MPEMVGRKYKDIRTQRVYTVTKYDDAQKMITLESPSGVRAEVSMADMVYSWERVH